MELRAEEPVRFARAMADMHVAELNRFAALDGPVLFDRGLPDVVGFLDVSGLPVPDALHRACIKLRYSGPILRAPPWQAIYRQDDERIQTFAQAVESDRAVILAWRRYGYDPVDLPLAPIAERLAFVKSALAV
jgi:predicted ATPase